MKIKTQENNTRATKQPTTQTKPNLANTTIIVIKSKQTQNNTNTVKTRKLKANTIRAPKQPSN